MAAYSAFINTYLIEKSNKLEGVQQWLFNKKIQLKIIKLKLLLNRNRYSTKKHFLSRSKQATPVIFIVLGIG